MSFSLEQLWQDAHDDKVIEAVEKWSSLNPEARRVVTAEVQRRGLEITLPEAAYSPAPATATDPAPKSSSARGIILMAAALGILVLIAVLFQ